MTKKAKRNKKYNPLKAQMLSAERTIKDFAIAMVLGETKFCTLIDYKTCKELNVSRAVADSVAEGCWNWYYECSVVCRSQTGEEYINSESHYFQSRYRQSDKRLNKYLNKVHAELKKKQNPLHVVTLAWVAIPVFDKAEELDLDTLGRIYKQLGAFDYLSKWENDQLEKEKLEEKETENA